MSDTLRDIVFDAIDQINALNEGDVKVEKDDSFQLLGNELIDSLTFINLVSTIEDEIEDRLGKDVTIIDEEVLSRTDMPLASVGTLLALITSKLEQA